MSAVICIGGDLVVTPEWWRSFFLGGFGPGIASKLRNTTSARSCWVDQTNLAGGPITGAIETGPVAVLYNGEWGSVSAVWSRVGGDTQINSNQAGAFSQTFVSSRAQNITYTSYFRAWVSDASTTIACNTVTVQHEHTSGA